jgi:DNA-binding NarL/FixJ family response regulator
MPIRVVVAEDNYLVRQGLIALLEATPELDVRAVCADYDSLLAAVEAEDPDVVLTDIRMPPTNTDEGLRAADWLREHRPDIGVVALSQYVEPEYAVALLDKGAAGRAYLLKERVSDADQLVQAVREVAAGGSVIDARVVDVLLSARARTPSVLDTLTKRELEVLERLSQGLNNAAIATSLGVTDHAVERHINAIFSKLALTEEADVHRRVKAALVFLSERPA